LRDLVLLDDIRQGKRISADAHAEVERLKSEGVIEIVGRGRGTRYILSKRFYSFIGERGVYTRRKGLDTEEKKALIVKHLKEHGQGTIQEFEQIFPNLTREQINWLVRQLKEEKRIVRSGARRNAQWILKE